MHCDRGFTPLDNAFFEALIRFPFSKRQCKVVLAVQRKTHGFQKSEDDISASQIALMTGIARSHVSLTINELVGLNVLTKRPGQFGQLLSVNQDYASWCWPEDVTETVTELLPKQYAACDRNSTAAVTETVHTINNHQKTITNKPLQKRSGRACLIFPKAMSAVEQQQADGLFAGISDADAQSILDVLAVMIQAGEVRKSRLAVLSGLLRRFRQGSFDPLPGIHLQQQREQVQRREQAMAAHEKHQQAKILSRGKAMSGNGFADVRAAMKRPAASLNN